MTEMIIRETAVEREPLSHSQWLAYLPAIYQGDPFMARFLRIFEETWEPLERQLGVWHHYFDPRTTPSEILPWLATWLGLVLDESWPETQRRQLVQRASELYRWRGTAWALREYLTLYLGSPPEIVEEEQPPFHFLARVRTSQPDDLDRERVHRIIEEMKPAHTQHTLEVLADE